MYYLCPLFEGLYVKVLRAKELSYLYANDRAIGKEGADCDRLYKQGASARCLSTAPRRMCTRVHHYA